MCGQPRGDHVPCQPRVPIITLTMLPCVTSLSVIQPLYCLYMCPPHIHVKWCPFGVFFRMAYYKVYKVSKYFLAAPVIWWLNVLTRSALGPPRPCAQCMASDNINNVTGAPEPVVTSKTIRSIVPAPVLSPCESWRIMHKFSSTKLQAPSGRAGRQRQATTPLSDSQAS